MKGESVLLAFKDFKSVETAIQQHCQHRGWKLFAVGVRTNHVHVVVGAADTKGQTIRDQLKANCTRELRQQSGPLQAERTWTKGGDCELLAGDDDIVAAVEYVLEAQDRKGRDRN